MCFLYHKRASIRKTRNAGLYSFYDFSPVLFKIKIFRVAVYYIDVIFSEMLLHLSLKASHIDVCLWKLYQY